MHMLSCGAMSNMLITEQHSSSYLQLVESFERVGGLLSACGTVYKYDLLHVHSTLALDHTSHPTL